MFRFSIRELLLVMLVVALAIGWWLDRSRLANRAGMWQSWGNDLKNILEDEGWTISLSESGSSASKDGRAISIGRLVPVVE